jgi:hypothetical protein
MHLLHTQIAQLRETLEDLGWKWSEFSLNESSSNPVISSTRSSDDGRTWTAVFKIAGGPGKYVLEFLPGEKARDQSLAAKDWDDVLVWFRRWLGFARRELIQYESTDALGVAPDWLAAKLPSEYRELQEKRSAIELRIATFDKAAALLWQKGKPLEIAVREVFKAAGFEATPTLDGATYDLTVAGQDGSGRLLVEVAGMEGSLSKRSGKITQLVDAMQHHQEDKDRLVLALNAQIGQRPQDRKEIVTVDALRILNGLSAVIVPTPLLFDIWRTTEQDPTRAASRLHTIWSAAPGIWA